MSTVHQLYAALVVALASLVSVPGLIAGIVYLVLNAINSRLDGVPDTRPERILDRLVIVTRAGAVNRASLPILGKSLFDEVVDFVRDEAERDSQPPPDGPQGAAGFAAVWVLRAVSLVMLALAFLFSQGCKLKPQDCETPFATRCSPRGVPQVCSADRRWSQNSSDPCPSSAPCGPVLIAVPGSDAAASHACDDPSAYPDAGSAE